MRSRLIRKDLYVIGRSGRWSRAHSSTPSLVQVRSRCTQVGRFFHRRLPIGAIIAALAAVVASVRMTAERKDDDAFWKSCIVFVGAGRPALMRKGRRRI